MSTLEIVIRIGGAALIASVLAFLILIFWPTDAKLYKLRPEDFANDEEYMKAIERANNTVDSTEDKS